MNVRHLTSDAETGQIIEAISQDGCVIIDRHLSKPKVDQLRSEVSPYLEPAKVGRADFTGFKTRRVGALMARSEVARSMALDPMVNRACQEALSPFCDAYQLHLTQAVSIAPGEVAQPVHRDRIAWGARVPVEIETQFSTIWAVDDFTKENGATYLTPGSHLWHDTARKPTESEGTYAEMDSGSVLLYNGSVLHGGGANNSTTPRLGVLLHYTLNWLRQEENQYMSFPPHVAKNFSPELRALVGYKSHYTMGFCTPPMEPGQGPELVSPERIFQDSNSTWPGL